ncbi:hypothetical protein J3R83DRAFT_11466 [Lanmaoa asiatica]|nr:hypothetical protein J3R83DRAFT_11466 [Lanmaoa asiatica]
MLSAVGTSPFVGGIACLPSVLLTALLGNITLGCSSTIFMIRTWVIWKDSCLVHVLLSLLSLVQLSMLVYDVTTVRSIVVNGVCEVYINAPQMNAAALIYTTCYDLLVFVLSVVGLSKQRSESPLKKRLYQQGIFYFAVAGIFYIPPVVFALLNNISLLLIFSNFAITASAIISSRAVRSLLSLGTSKPGPESNVALTTQIVIRPSISHEDTN